MLSALMVCVSILAFVPILAGASSAAPRTGAVVRMPGNVPSDGDFKAIFTPVFVSIPVVEAPTSRLVGVFETLNQLFRTQNRFDEVVVALRVSLDRAEGAAAAGDSLWLGRQEDASAEYALEAVTLLKNFPPLNAAVESAFLADGFTLKITRQQFAAGQAYFAHHGLPPEFTHLLKVAAGALRPQTSAEVKTLKHAVVGHDRLRGGPSCRHPSLGGSAGRARFPYLRRGTERPPPSRASRTTSCTRRQPNKPSSACWLTASPRVGKERPRTNTT